MKISTTSLFLCALCPLLTTAFVDFNKRFGTGKVDCRITLWSDWKCDSTLCTRTRKIHVPSRNGGIPCPTKLVETKDAKSSEDPWKQSQKQVTAQVQKKFMVGNGRVLSLAKTQGKQEPVKVLQSRDLMFLLDMSGSISKKDFRETKRKMGEMIQRICGTIGNTRDDNRIAVIAFSKSVNLHFNFKTHFDLKSVKESIMKIKQERSLTCTGDAFKFASSYMFDPDSGIRDATESVKEVLVLTDGRSNCGVNLAKEVKKLQVKAFVFALAIGMKSKKGRAEIESMVSRPLIDHVFSLSNFNSFFEMVDALKAYIDQNPTSCLPLELSKR